VNDPTETIRRNRKIDVGDSVTCKFEVEAYYSNFNGSPLVLFKPGMVGVVAYIAPKVRIIVGLPTHDSRSEFLAVDFTDENCKPARVGLNFCNATKLPNT
jgi:hypothetical protein